MIEPLSGAALAILLAYCVAGLPLWREMRVLRRTRTGNIVVIVTGCLTLSVAGVLAWAADPVQGVARPIVPVVVMISTALGGGPIATAMLRLPDPGSRAALPEMGWIRDYITPERISAVRQLTELAASLDLTTAQLSIAWILRRKEVSSVITGATRIEQLDENLGAAEAYERLTEELVDEIFRIITPIEES